MSQQGQPVPDVPPQPVPISTAVMLAGAPSGERMVVLRASTPQGVTMLFLSPDHAAQLAGELASLAQQARTPGLVIAQPAQAKFAVDRLRRNGS